MEQPDTQRFIDMLSGILDLILPSYQRERRPYLTVAIGCTGGRHRSVVIADKLAARFKEGGFTTSLVHRDITK